MKAKVKELIAATQAICPVAVLANSLARQAEWEKVCCGLAAVAGISFGEAEKTADDLLRLEVDLAQTLPFAAPPAPLIARTFCLLLSTGCEREVALTGWREAVAAGVSGIPVSRLAEHLRRWGLSWLEAFRVGRKVAAFCQEMRLAGCPADEHGIISAMFSPVREVEP